MHKCHPTIQETGSSLVESLGTLLQPWGSSLSLPKAYKTPLDLETFIFMTSPLQFTVLTCTLGYQFHLINVSPHDIVITLSPFIIMSSRAGPPPPPGGDRNRADQVHAFTWSLESIALVFVLARMYSRVKLTRNVWWDDWCICIAQVPFINLDISMRLSLIETGFRSRHFHHVECLRWKRLC